MNLFSIKNFLVLVLLLYLLPMTSFSAEIFLESKNTTSYVGEEFLVEVFLNTKDASVNAIEGKIKFPSQFLDFKEAREGNSLINFWVEKPSLTNDGEVSFSGITPGGFQGSNKFLFGLVFSSKNPGNVALVFSDLKVLKNDGLGTEIITTPLSYEFNISNEQGVGTFENLTIVDNEPPEEFFPLIASDLNLFDGKYFVVFSAIDKGSGIYGYTVSESMLGPNGVYLAAESPYMLKDQSLSKNIYIKAIDKSGNFRLVTLDAQNPIIWLKPDIIFGIILVILCLFVFKKIWSKYTQR